MRLAQAVILILLLASPAAARETAAGDDVPKLVELLKSGDARVRSQARHALTGIGKDAVPELIAALERRESLGEAVYVLNGIKDGRAAKPLSKLLDLGDPETLEKVKSALFSLGRASMPHLFDAMKDPARRKAAAEALSSLKDPEYFKKIQKLLKDDDPALRRHAAAVEKNWLDPGAVQDMARLLKDPDAEIRREASAYFLGLSPDYETPGLPALLEDPDGMVRVNAVRIVIKARKTDVYAQISGMAAGDTDSEARRLAAEALFRCYRDNALQPLVSALKDKDDAVAVAAANWLGQMKAKEAVPEIAALLNRSGKPSDEVVEVAARALGEVGEGYDPNIFLPYINWENLYVVRAILKAWEPAARPSDAGIKDALARYLDMQVDVRYKDRAKMLLQRLSQAR